MPRIAILILILAGSSTFTSAQKRTVGLAIDLYTSYAVIDKDGFNDPKVLFGHDYGWLNDVRDGSIFEGKLSLRLPLGIHPYIGYHFGILRESGANSTLWRNIYGQDFDNNFETKDYEIKYWVYGRNIGIAYEAYWLKWRVKPYILVEQRTENFRAETRIEGSAEDVSWSPEEQIEGTFSGQSDLQTETATGYGVGIGFKIPVGNFSLVPEVKYVSANTKISRRYLELWVTSADGSFRRGFGGWSTIPDGQSIKHQYLEIVLGISYNLF